jgi:antitoxin (DNA-binding transcriptional repressor) of toxin-antitoxin stability system
MQKIVGLKELRLNMDKYARKVREGESFVIFNRTKPIFQITPLDEQWEEVIDFTKIKKGGVDIDEILSRL